MRVSHRCDYNLGERPARGHHAITVKRPLLRIRWWNRYDSHDGQLCVWVRFRLIPEA